MLFILSFLSVLKQFEVTDDKDTHDFVVNDDDVTTNVNIQTNHSSSWLVLFYTICKYGKGVILIHV